MTDEKLAARIDDLRAELSALIHIERLRAENLELQRELQGLQSRYDDLYKRHEACVQAQRRISRQIRAAFPEEETSGAEGLVDRLIALALGNPSLNKE